MTPPCGVLTIYAHPNPRSFCHAVLEQLTAGLREAGQEVEVVDFYAIKFDPCSASATSPPAVRPRRRADTMNELLLYTGGALPMLWGAAHLYPTRKVVEGFGAITRDNQLVLTMEWIAEAILLLFIGTLVIVTTARFGADGAASETTFAASALALLVLAGVSAATGGRVDFIVYRLCAPIFTLSPAPSSSARRRVVVAAGAPVRALRGFVP